MPNLSPLASPSATRAALEEHGLATKKALGQNFLINDAVLQKIVALADLNPSDVVLEVGPGIGTLTIALLKCTGCVVSVERDTDLPAVLAHTCALWGDRFSLINKDALALAEEDVRGALASIAPGSSSDFAASFATGDTRDVSAGNDVGESGCGACAHSASGSREHDAKSDMLPNKFVANLPYAVAATLVLDYFERFAWLQSATVMVQKEVADRMMARPGTKDYGAFTVKLSLYAQPAGRFPVGPSNFFPPPRVDSAVLRLDRCDLRDEEGGLVPGEVKRAAAVMADAVFANRRKTAANSCKTYFSGKVARGCAGVSAGKEAADKNSISLPSGAFANEAIPDAVSRIFERAGLDSKRRGETFSTQDFVRLGKAYLACLG